MEHNGCRRAVEHTIGNTAQLRKPFFEKIKQYAIFEEPREHICDAFSKLEVPPANHESRRHASYFNELVLYQRCNCCGWE